MDLREVTVSRLTNQLGDLYVELFGQRFFTRPWLSDKDNDVFRWLASQFPDKATTIVTKYFDLSDPFIVSKKYPPSQIRTQINQILGELGLGEGKKTNPRDVCISCWLSCDKCHAQFKWSGMTNDLAKPNYQRLCEKCKPALDSM